ncbi:MAG: hypothetical protein QW242_02380 [Desulfurococcaceae archaeon]
MLLLIFVSIFLTNFIQEAQAIDKFMSLKPTPIFPPIINTTRIELASLVEDNILDLFVVKNYLFLFSYDLFNATYRYNITVFNMNNLSRVFEKTFYSSGTYERISIVYDEDEVVAIVKNRLFYFNLANNSIIDEAIDLDSNESFVNAFKVDGYILVLTTNRLLIFGYASSKSIKHDLETIGSVIGARIWTDKLTLVIQTCRQACDLNVVEYKYVNDTYISTKKLVIRLSKPINTDRLYIDRDYVKLVDSGELIIVSKDGNISRIMLNITGEVVFESFYNDEIFIVTYNTSSNALIYWFFKDKDLIRKLELDGENSIYRVINSSVDYYSSYDQDTGLITIYGYTRNMLIHELIDDENLTRMLFIIRTVGYEYIDRVALFPNYRIFLITSQKLGIERYAYLYSIDGNFVFKLGYMLTNPSVNIVNDKLTITFVTLEYGVKKILVCYVDKPAILVIRGIKATISFHEYTNRSVSYLYSGGGPDILILPSSKGLLRVISRTCYIGPEELYDAVEISFSADKLNYINTTIYSAQLHYISSVPTYVLFIDRNNSTRTFTVTLMNTGVCYIPPGDYIVEAYRAETGLSIKISLKLDKGGYAEVDFDELFRRAITESPMRNRYQLAILAILIFIIIVTILFIRSIVQYKKTYS